MTVYVKNMVCVRCKMAVQAVLESLDIDYASIELGRVKLNNTLDRHELIKLDTALRQYELELLEDRQQILTERIKTIIIEQLMAPEVHLTLKLSAVLSKALQYNYTYLANLFSEVEGITIERFYVETRVGRVKELLVYENLTLSEIAYRLNYSSVSHLSLQFKKVTGQSPAAFKKLCRSDDYIWRAC